MLTSLKWRYKPEERHTASWAQLKCFCLLVDVNHIGAAARVWVLSLAQSSGAALVPAVPCSCPCAPSAQGCCEPGTVSVSVPVLRAGSSLSCLCLFPALTLPWHQPRAGLGPGTATSAVPWLSPQPFLLTLQSPDLSAPPGQYLHQILGCLLLWNSQWASGVTLKCFRILEQIDGWIIQITRQK